MAIIKKAKNINIQVANNYTSISKISHEQSEEVIMEATVGNLELSSQKRAIMQGFGKDSEKNKHETDNKVESIIGDSLTYIFEWVEYSVQKFKKEPSFEDRKNVNWVYEDSKGNRTQLKGKEDKLRVYLTNPDDFGKDYKIFAYLQSLSESVYFKSHIVDELHIVNRKSWKARLPQTGGNYSYEEIAKNPKDYYDTIVIHHSGNAKSYPSVREIQDEHMDKMDKADIGYHFAINRYGKIFEGRPINIKGAHVDLANTAKIGIVLLADLSSDNNGLTGIKKKIEEYNGNDYLTDKMEISLLRLCIYLDKLYKIDKVGGHMEIASSSKTEERYCPGNLTMEKMENWRKILNKKKP
ncbi:peptidoglycan recognition protein family protein [Frigoriflavimonas asaccharolytica]|uniref:Peptidoglycan recognition protein family domain-containing protein n=1 Tax=Frigoriflavimonas asaccharolytica TaxID=2735899 RepID=A0A8J8KCX1_9FLAO|nr:peptidoglycan recognition family protein [Frigoriflavimonas asaccharolytica]NRS94114.1 hypothetical protein [Frigoriflavimonas asaccharolytica]